MELTFPDGQNIQADNISTVTIGKINVIRSRAKNSLTIYFMVSIVTDACVAAGNYATHDDYLEDTADHSMMLVGHTYDYSAFMKAKFPEARSPGLPELEHWYDYSQRPLRAELEKQIRSFYVLCAGDGKVDISQALLPALDKAVEVGMKLQACKKAAFEHEVIAECLKRIFMQGEKPPLLVVKLGEDLGDNDVPDYLTEV